MADAVTNLEVFNTAAAAAAPPPSLPSSIQKASGQDLKPMISNPPRSSVVLTSANP